MIAIILNETAGSGKAAALGRRVEDWLRARNVDYRLYRTERAGHGTELARRAVSEGAQTVFAMGGDGLAQEVARGVYGTDAALGILPAGTGNDFIKSLGLPKDPVRALEQALSHTPQPVDVGLANEAVFLNIAGAGLDVSTLLWARRFKRLGSGMISYLLGALCAVAKPFTAQVTADGQALDPKHTLVLAANVQYFGGGMRLAPDAQVADGLFDVVTIRWVPRLLMIFLLPIAITGHSRLLGPLVQTRRCRQVTVRQEGLMMELDGEFVSADEITLRIVPGGIRIAV